MKSKVPEKSSASGCYCTACGAEYVETCRSCEKCGSIQVVHRYLALTAQDKVLMDRDLRGAIRRIFFGIGELIVFVIIALLVVVVGLLALAAIWIAIFGPLGPTTGH